MGRGAEQRVFDAIDPDKDVDGFHPVNVGQLVQGRAHLEPCTPSGVIELLERSAIADRRPPRRRHRPQRHRRQADGAAAAAARRDGDDLPFEDAGSAAVAARGDILVAAIGRPGFVTARLRQAGRDGDRRRHDAGQRSSGRRAIVRRRLAAARGVRRARLARRRRRASRRSRTSPAR